MVCLLSPLNYKTMYFTPWAYQTRVKSPLRWFRRWFCHGGRWHGQWCFNDYPSSTVIFPSHLNSQPKTSSPLPLHSPHWCATCCGSRQQPCGTALRCAAATQSRRSNGVLQVLIREDGELWLTMSVGSQAKKGNNGGAATWLVQKHGGGVLFRAAKCE